MLNDIGEILRTELEIDISDATKDDTLLSVGIDSITFMTLVIYVEEKFDIEFTFDGVFMQEYKTVTFGDLMEEIQKLIDEKAD